MLMPIKSMIISITSPIIVSHAAVSTLWKVTSVRLCVKTYHLHSPSLSYLDLAELHAVVLVSDTPPEVMLSLYNKQG